MCRPRVPVVLSLYSDKERDTVFGREDACEIEGWAEDSRSWVVLVIVMSMLSYRRSRRGFFVHFLVISSPASLRLFKEIRDVCYEFCFSVFVLWGFYLE